VRFLDSQNQQTQYGQEVKSPRHDREEIDQAYLSIRRSLSGRLTPETSTKYDEESSQSRLQRHGIIGGTPSMVKTTEDFGHMMIFRRSIDQACGYLSDNTSRFAG
jgi:hypothetical protein